MRTADLGNQVRATGYRLAIAAFLEYINFLMVRAFASFFGFTYRYWGFAL
jgi:hypothetical protein